MGENNEGYFEQEELEVEGIVASPEDSLEILVAQKEVDLEAELNGDLGEGV